MVIIDLAFWIWFAIYDFTHYYPGIFTEGLLVTMVLYMPSFILLPILGSLIILFLNVMIGWFINNETLFSQFFILFTADIIQYFFINIKNML